MRPTCSVKSCSLTALVRAGSTTKSSTRAVAVPSTQASSTTNGFPSRASTRTVTRRLRLSPPAARRVASFMACREQMTRTKEPDSMGRTALQHMTEPVLASAGAVVVRNFVGSLAGRISRRSPPPTKLSRRTSTSKSLLSLKRSRPPFAPPLRNLAPPQSREATTRPTSRPLLLERS